MDFITTAGPEPTPVQEGEQDKAQRAELEAARREERMPKCVACGAQLVLRSWSEAPVEWTYRWDGRNLIGRPAIDCNTEDLDAPEEWPFCVECGVRFEVYGDREYVEP